MRVAASLAALGALVTAVGCARAPEPVAARPRAEFLVSAGDSTYWVTTDAAGVRVRSSPLFLARFDGRLYEVYAADDDESYYDALFTTQRIYRRDLQNGDSLSVFDDATVPRLARRYAAAHPDESPLEPDEDAAEEPREMASTEVTLVDVHGPYLTYEHRADVDAPGEAHRHATRRAVVDLRTGQPASLEALLGPREAAAVVAEGARRFAAARDSLLALAAVEEDETTAARARRALALLRFEPASFGLVSLADRPGVQFLATAPGGGRGGATLSLAPIPVAPPAWWSAEVRGTLPATVAADSSEAWWHLGGLELLARRGSGGRAQLVLRGAGAAGTRRIDWALARVAGPVRQVVPLDRPPLAAAARRALARAFDESALYGEEVTAAAYHPRQGR